MAARPYDRVDDMQQRMEFSLVMVRPHVFEMMSLLQVQRNATERNRLQVQRNGTQRNRLQVQRNGTQRTEKIRLLWTLVFTCNNGRKRLVNGRVIRSQRTTKVNDVQ